MQQILTWLVPIVIRGIAWILSYELGMAAVQSTDMATKIVEWLVAGLALGLSIYTSIQGRKKLLATPPPKQ